MQHTAAQDVEISHEPIEPAQRIDEDAAVTTGYLELGTLNGCSLGVWEMSAGQMADIEEDEYFVVLAGRGTVQVLAENGFTEQNSRAYRWQRSASNRWDEHRVESRRAIAENILHALRVRREQPSELNHIVRPLIHSQFLN